MSHTAPNCMDKQYYPLTRVSYNLNPSEYFLEGIALFIYLPIKEKYIKALSILADFDQKIQQCELIVFIKCIQFNSCKIEK